MTTSQGAVRLTGDQIHEAGEVLASAYADDPLMEYREPDEAKRQRWSPCGSVGAPGLRLGTALMQRILAKADGDRVPCYLETQKARNVPLYQRHGFVVLEEIDLPEGGPHMWTMRRDAR